MKNQLEACLLFGFKYLAMDDTAKGGLNLFLEYSTVIPIALKDFNLS